MWAPSKKWAPPNFLYQEEEELVPFYDMSAWPQVKIFWQMFVIVLHNRLIANFSPVYVGSDHGEVLEVARGATHVLETRRR